MEFDKSFFEDEIRDGFYVSAEMKHAWAAQLEVLNDVDKACKRMESSILQSGEHFSEQ